MPETNENNTLRIIRNVIVTLAAAAAIALAFWAALSDGTMDAEEAASLRDTIAEETGKALEAWTVQDASEDIPAADAE